MKILGIEIQSGVYKSTSYLMYVDKGNKELQKQLNKTYYIQDKKERLKQVRNLLKNNIDTEHNTYVSKGNIPNWEKHGFKSLDEYYELQNESMFYNIWVEVSNKRALEIEVYVQTIYGKAENLLQSNEYDAICCLIDEQFKSHKKVFDDPKSDYAFRFQYNQLIYDLLQKKINEIVKTPVDDIRLTINTKKPLIWNAKKTSIGTLFGMLYNSEIISGTKEDLKRALTSMFSNLSENTLHDNLNLKIVKNENKILYDTKTEDQLKDWVKYLKSTMKKK